MLRPLILLALVLQLLPISGWGAVPACTDLECAATPIDSSAAGDVEDATCCANACRCGEACSCAEQREPEEPDAPRAPLERRLQSESPESTPRLVVHTAAFQAPEPREVALLSKGQPTRAPTLHEGRSLRASICVWTP